MIHCACVIHGDVYPWHYVDRLHNMLHRALPGGMHLHVYTEPDRAVPDHMTKHELTLWKGVGGARKSWWYKMQLFNPEHFSDNLLYFDLDTIIVRDLEWLTRLSTNYLWSIRDFRHLQKQEQQLMNSSVMWWNVERFADVWQGFCNGGVMDTVRRYPGDQDYLTQAINHNRRRFFEDKYFESYRWQVLDGGYDFKARKYRRPGSGTTIQGDTAVVVFHGSPKPHEVGHPEIRDIWQ